ncbi:MAG: hypothetical protein PVH19_12860, partial [Planctomycetia bacterium]
ESDFQEEEGMSLQEQAELKQERMKLEDIIDQTDRIVQIKIQEIEELQTLLQSQSSQVGNLSVGIGAFEEAFNQDELIVEERENLKRLQDELHDKLKKAEIEISLERAKVARERSQMDEVLAALGLSRENMQEVLDEAKRKEAANIEEKHRAVDPKGNKQVNWFGQLGLGGEEKKQK